MICPDSGRQEPLGNNQCRVGFAKGEWEGPVQELLPNLVYSSLGRTL